jgi:anti-sigma factor RsiW
MACDRALQTQAYLDGELDFSGALETERHLETCADCAMLKGEIEAFRGLLRDQAPYHRADLALRARVRRALGESQTRQPWFKTVWAGAAGGVAATALAASVILALLLPPASEALVGDVTNAHLRALASDRLIEVASSDSHTVKPWLAAHADSSPPVGDFAAQGFALAGGRVDFIGGVRAAATVFRHGKHSIDVFAWHDAGGRLPDAVTRSGYHLLFWRQGDLVFCAVSDISVGDIETLSRLLQAPIAPGGRE